MTETTKSQKIKEFLRKLWEGDQPAQDETTAEFLQSIAAMLVIGLYLVTFNLQAFEIPSGSMENTLLIGDHVLVDRISAAPETKWVGPLLPYQEIKHDEIIVFLHPATPGLHVVKRIIGIPGDHLRLHDGVVYRNGQPLTEPYVIRKKAFYSAYREEFPNVPTSGEDGVTDIWSVEMPLHRENEELVVPPGYYFGMGDNRHESLDSRYWGFIPRQNIVGRPLFVYWSFVTPERQYEKTEIVERMKFLGHIILHFFTETRWNRTLKFVH